jgi:hypothetical protein
MESASAAGALPRGTAAVEVNEAKIFATRGGSDWWLMFRSRFEPIDRIKVITASLGGDRVEVQCDDREHADWLLAHAVGNGVPQSALKVKEGK